MTVVGEGVETHIQRSHLGAVACERRRAICSRRRCREGIAELVLSARTPGALAADVPAEGPRRAA